PYTTLFRSVKRLLGAVKATEVTPEISARGTQVGLPEADVVSTELFAGEVPNRFDVNTPDEISPAAKVTAPVLPATEVTSLCASIFCQSVPLEITQSPTVYSIPSWVPETSTI